MQKIKLLYIFLLFIPCISWAQLQEYPLEPKKNAKRILGAKTQELQVSLPFWDDFSLSEDHPSDLLWINNTKVSVNMGQAFNPPTTKVASFDGLNENGIPYSPNPADENDYGYRDTLESQPIKLTEVPVANRDSIFLSFFFQAGGNVEPPNQNDFLRLEFKSPTGWNTIKTYRIDTRDPSLFYYELIKIGNEYIHDGFRFRFISFGKKSGRYDAWHLDYVYLNVRKRGSIPLDEDFLNSFPDRSFSSTLSGMLGEYQSMPVKHFLLNRSISEPSIGLRNLQDYDQPNNYKYTVTVRSFNDQILLDENSTDFQFPNTNMAPFENRTIQLAGAPPASAFDMNADSITLKYKMDYSGGGDMIKPDYGNIDFTVNDTVTFHYSLFDYYAYDDGEAEYSAGLTQTGNQLAYQFIVEPGNDSIMLGVDIYFPAFAGSNPPNVDIFVLDTLIDSKPLEPLYEQTVDIPPGVSAFKRIDFFTGIIVVDTFYIGYREPITGNVRIGLDKNNNSGHRMFHRERQTSAWQVNDRIIGSLMIRPRFGPADIIVGLPETQSPVSIYPNPSHGSFYMKGPVDQLQISTLTGQPVYFATENFGEEKRIDVQAQTGFYIVRYRSGSKIYTGKILIQD